MHERSLVDSLLDQVERLRLAHGAARVVSVRVGVGALCGVDPELFRLAFEDMVDATPLRGVALELEEVPLELECLACATRFPSPRFRFICPSCRGGRVRALRGEHLMLDRVILDRSEPDAAGAAGGRADH